jgi:hypothetical protein
MIELLFVSVKMGQKKVEMEKKIVEQELGKLIAFTMQLEDELNAVVKYE